MFRQTSIIKAVSPLDWQAIELMIKYGNSDHILITSLAVVSLLMELNGAIILELVNW